MSNQTKQVVPAGEQTGCLGGVVRLVWLAIGNVALLFLVVAIAQRRGLSALDLAFWALLAGLIIVRYLDITRLGGLTADGNPASLKHWRRYLVFLILVSGGLWLWPMASRTSWRPEQVICSGLPCAPVFPPSPLRAISLSATAQVPDPRGPGAAAWPSDEAY